MKKYTPFLLLFCLFFGSMQLVHAQFRPYPEPVFDDVDISYPEDPIGNPGDTSDWLNGDPNVDFIGNPVSCCESAPFNFTLNFSSFNTLLALENAMLRAQWEEVKKWLDKQEETFRKEINNLMDKNYATFSEAQREFFKFYDGGRYGNGGVINLANKLLGDNSRWASEYKEKAISSLIKNKIIDEWIACEYCTELQGMAYFQAGLAQYDDDSTPSPRFYAKMESDTQAKRFGDNAYRFALHNAKALGLEKMIVDGNILNRLSDIRVNHYRNQGLKESVFLMSAYLINVYTYCPVVQSTCLPEELQPYSPPIFNFQSMLYQWAESYSPKINEDLILLSDYYDNLPYDYYSRRFGSRDAFRYYQNIDLAREFVRKELFNNVVLFGESPFLQLPPSCKSFNFKNAGSNWQEASVIGIKFNIVVIEIIAGIRVKKIIPVIFPEPVKFGIPKKFKNRSTISPGLAAELSAEAIKQSIDDVISKYNNLVLSSTNQIRIYFKEQLKHNLSEISNGGRINFNDMSSTNTPTVYKTSAFFDDKCQ